MRQLIISKSITKREDTSLDKYFNEISKEEMISVDEEIELARRIKKGDQQALQKLASANLRFVVSVAKQYQNYGLSLQDLINEGNIGLIKAAQKFDETKGFKFISYAVWWIRQSIQQAIAEQTRIVRLPLNKVDQLNKLNKASNYFELEYEREPTAEELAVLTDMPEEKIHQLIENAGGQVSFDAPLKSNEDTELIDVTANRDVPDTDDKLLKDSLYKELSRVLKTLTKREEEIIRYLYGIGCRELTLEEITRKFGLSKEGVRQIKQRALQRLQKNKQMRLLQQYL